MRAGRSIEVSAEVPRQQDRTLLLLDDDEFMLSALATTLHTEGYRILRATRPSEALDFLAKHKIGVLICDQQMPEMNGIELLSKVRCLHPATVRIMLTGHGEAALSSAAINEGSVYKFIVKPWDNDQIRSHVREAFHHYERLHPVQREQPAA